MGGPKFVIKKIAFLADYDHQYGRPITAVVSSLPFSVIFRVLCDLRGFQTTTGQLGQIVASVFLRFHSTVFALHFIVEEEVALDLRIGANYKDFILEGLSVAHEYLDRFSVDPMDAWPVEQPLRFTHAPNASSSNGDTEPLPDTSDHIASPGSAATVLSLSARFGRYQQLAPPTPTRPAAQLTPPAATPETADPPPPYQPAAERSAIPTSPPPPYQPVDMSVPPPLIPVDGVGIRAATRGNDATPPRRPRMTFTEFVRASRLPGQRRLPHRPLTDVDRARLANARELLNNMFAVDGQRGYCRDCVLAGQRPWKKPRRPCPKCNPTPEQEDSPHGSPSNGAPPSGGASPSASQEPAASC